MKISQKKKKYTVFKLKLIIGKIKYRKHPCFSEEVLLASDLVQLHKDFNWTLNILNIPYLIEKRKHIEMKLNEYHSIHQLTEA